MLNLQKIIWKIPITTPKEANPDKFFQVFSTWIPESPEIFVDVADYQHVTDGPLTFLIGHYVDFVLDITEDQLNMYYRGKQDIEGSNAEKIQKTLHEALKGFQRMAQDKEFAGKLKFDTSKLQFMINDRALAPNSKETFAAVNKDLQSVLDKAFKDNKCRLQYDQGDPRTRFSVNISAKEKTDLKKLIDNLN